MKQPVSTQHTTTAGQLEALMDQQLQVVDKILHHLDQIKQSIAQNDHDQLEKLTHATPADFQHLEQLHHQQQQIMQASGFSLDRHGSISGNNSPDCEQLKQAHLELTQKMEQLQQSLLINDLLLKKNQHRVRQSIRILTGHPKESATTTYSDQGSTTNNGSVTRTLARA